MPSTNWLKTATFLSQAFKEAKIEHCIYGSGAALLHGVNFSAELAPADIDIAVGNIPAAKVLLIKLASENKIKLTESPSTLAVIKYTVQLNNHSPISLDITFKEELGLQFVEKVEKYDITTLSLVDTLRSLFLRNPKRAKDIFAVNELCRMYGKEISESPALLKDKTSGFKEYVMLGIASAKKKASTLSAANASTTKDLKHQQAPYPKTIVVIPANHAPNLFRPIATAKPVIPSPTQTMDSPFSVASASEDSTRETPQSARKETPSETSTPTQK